VPVVRRYATVVFPSGDDRARKHQNALAQMHSAFKGEAMSERTFKRLFTPVTLRGRTLRNRIVFGAHTANMAVEGLPTERHVGY
jgi:hypothetical protein